MKDWKKKSKKTLSLYNVNLPVSVYKKAQNNLDEILLNEEVSSELAPHCYIRIFPMIALYLAFDKTIAYEQVSKLFWNKQVIPGISWIQRLLKIPGLYKLIPRLASFSVKNKYKPSKEGFQYEILEESRLCFRADFCQCPYYSYCLKYGVPELCDVFCTSDEIIARAMEPYIIFKRSQTLGRGGTCCDFKYEINPEFQDRNNRRSKN